jgi:hypothetical protein
MGRGAEMEIGSTTSVRRREHSSTYKRRRAVIAAGVAGAIATVIYGVGRFVESTDTAPAGTPGDRTCPTVVVEPGDTLWGIARKQSPNGDPRPIVSGMVEKRGTSVLYPGDRVELPC